MTYGLGQMLSETGGLFKFLDFFFCFFFGLVSPVRLFPYLAAALYRDDEEEQTMIDKFVKKEDTTRGVNYAVKEEFSFIVPTIVDLKSILFKFCCCWL
jgi:hypothetical protein